jgi:hypothetical protein
VLAVEPRSDAVTRCIQLTLRGHVVILHRRPDAR